MIDLTPATDAMSELLATVTDRQLTAATPCAGMNVGDLIDHVDGASRSFTSLASHVAPGGGRPPDAENLEVDWRATVPQHVTELGRAWSDPAAWEGSTPGTPADMPNELWGKIALTEMVVHGWDIARSTGQRFDLPEPTLAACFDHVAQFVPNAPFPDLWGPPVEVAADASLMEQIAALTGRTPR
jgi:uncharacterized protein (TIGR03086 family)